MIYLDPALSPCCAWQLDIHEPGCIVRIIRPSHYSCVDHEGFLSVCDGAFSRLGVLIDQRPPTVVAVDCVCARTVYVGLARIWLPGNNLRTITFVNVTEAMHTWSRSPHRSKQFLAPLVALRTFIHNILWWAVSHDNVDVGESRYWILRSRGTPLCNLNWATETIFVMLIEEGPVAKSRRIRRGVD